MNVERFINAFRIATYGELAEAREALKVGIHKGADPSELAHQEGFIEGLEWTLAQLEARAKKVA